MEKTPHELWKESGENPERYRALMIEQGLLIDRRESPPEPHLFDGQTALCFCSVCGGRANAPWHIEGIRQELIRLARDGGASDEEIEDLEKLNIEQISTQQGQRTDSSGEG